MWIDSERLIHSFKTGLGCLVGFAMTKALHAYLFFDQWLIVTILVVMCAQISVGSIVFKSMIRFIGTCIGTLIAAISILTFGDDPLKFAAVIGVTGMIFSYFATGQQSYSDAGTLGAVTTAIILINPNPTLTLSAERFFEISIGIIIATLISQFVLPIHARKHLRYHQSQALTLLGDYYRNATLKQPADKEKMAELDENIVQSLRTQRKLANEAQRELLGSKFEPKRFQQIMECEKRILRSIDFLNRIFAELKLHHLVDHSAEWQKFNQAIAALFNQLARQVENPQPTSSRLELPSITALKEELATNSKQDSENLKLAHALFFCLDNITSQVKELAEVVN